MKPLAEQSHYEVLELEPSASPAEIRGAYERLRGIFGPGSLAMYAAVDPAEQEALLARLDEACGVLLDPPKRRAYDGRLGIASVVSEPVLEVAPAVAEPQELELGDEDVLEVLAAPADLDSAEIEPDDVLEVLESVEIGAAAPAPEPEPDVIDLSPEELDALVIAEPPLPQDFTGETLAALRRSRGLSLEEMAKRTRIKPEHLENLEADRFAALPERVFLRGILAAYARELRLDTTRVCDSYLARVVASPRTR